MLVTFRHWGSLPRNRVFPPERLSGGKAFVAMARILDRGQTGPLYLRRPEIASCVAKALREGDSRLGKFDLHA